MRKRILITMALCLLAFTGVSNTAKAEELPPVDAAALPVESVPAAPDTAAYPAVKIMYDYENIVSITTPNGVAIYVPASRPDAKWPDFILNAIDAAGITNEMSDYDKCVAINNYICSVVQYDYDYIELKTAKAMRDQARVAELKEINKQRSITDEWGKFRYGTDHYCLLTGYTICEGYADAFRSMCCALGIECYTAIGSASNSAGVTEDHVWNMVNIDGKEYHVDVTWNDKEGENKNKYLMTETLWGNHQLEGYWLMPNHGYYWIKNEHF